VQVCTNDQLANMLGSASHRRVMDDGIGSADTRGKKWIREYRCILVVSSRQARISRLVSKCGAMAARQVFQKVASGSDVVSNTLTFHRRDGVISFVLALGIQCVVLAPFVLLRASPVESPRGREFVVSLARAHDPIAAARPPALELVAPVQGVMMPPPFHTADNTTPSLPPRPDPARANLSPASPFAGAIGSHKLVVLLRAFVLVDGSVGETRVTGSCGLPMLDVVAAAFVRANWHFLPAMEHGHPKPQWTMLEVSFGW
jgi:hypothetical protein